MKYRFFLLLLLSSLAFSQEIYVDPLLGKDLNTGSKTAPYQSLKRAVTAANSLTGSGAIRIKLFPGLYTLSDKVSINPVRIMTDTTRYFIEAVYLPNTESWTPDQMPIIQSTSSNNSKTQFNHATGLLIATNHVTIQGLKFLGNANPNVQYYYPITKEDSSLEDLHISQCYFIGAKESAPIQGGVWAHGPKNTIANCIFYECRNAVLFFNNVAGFTIKNSIVYGAYESAFWFGPDDVKFTFVNNIIIRNSNFLVGPENLVYSSYFSNSIISENEAFVGYWSRSDQKVVAIKKPNIKLRNIEKLEKSKIIENNAVLFGRQHLHIPSDKVKAGIIIEN